MSPMDYKNSLRIRQTQRPLPDTEMSVSEIADISNLDNACYYTVFSNHAQAYHPLNAKEKHQNVNQSMNYISFSTINYTIIE